ncbi:ABC transporter substrate-binding protein [Rhizobacter sp. Root404]|uniref:ABC transporter substrate-binding protein n=1 Tax=Rhizobacter sp. Root404 TaxID=1736528 RepID=UPI0006FFFBE6|nr:ABC transporter substrate-binding protein [Rhizobacter sp. Root404]KQW35661.1 bicyclomycin resistance protein [Rhizobacter sp. Root404]
MSGAEFTRRSVLAAGAGAALGLPAAARAEPGKKVLRYAFEVAETSLDPAKINDLYSRILTPHIFEGLYHYDHLARPIKIKPLTADGMPQASSDFRTWTVKIRPGIYFADDPAFRGKRRELVAQDYVYSFKRFADPANKSPVWSGLETERLLGLNELRQAGLDARKPFDYDREIEGLRALDRYTLQFKVAEPRPRFHENLASGDLFGAVAREVIEFYGEEAESHPVGTGPFRLVQWRRSSFIAFERNPGFREMFYDAEPAADDAEGQAWAARLKGRRLPMVDRVEISIIEEEQPRWLAFLNNQADLQFEMGFQFIPQAMPNGKVAPNLAKRGIKGYRYLEPTVYCAFFNMEDAVIGGYEPARIALRRAIGLGMDARTLVAYAYNGQGAAAQTPLLPHTSNYDPHYRSEFGEYDPARAQALLDLYGYVDKDGDGWREQPDGSPLVLRINTQSDQRSRKIAEVMDRNLRALRIRSESVVAQWPENLKAARAGKLQVWTVGSQADAPDSIGALARYDSRQIGGQNMARFRMPAFDALYDRAQALPDGPERAALFDQAQKLALAYMPYKYTIHRISTDMAQPWLIGYRHPVFWTDWWQYVDIDDSLRNPTR